MDHKKIMNILLGFTLLLLVFGIGLTFPEKIGLCSSDTNAGCIEKFATNIGESLLLSAIFLGIVFFILRFLPKDIFRAWSWFASWYIPLVAIWIIITPAYGGAFLSPGKDAVTLVLGGVYMAVSTLIISIRLIFLKLRKKTRWG